MALSINSLANEPHLRPSPAAAGMRPVPEDLMEFCEWYFLGGMKVQPPQIGLLWEHKRPTLASSVVLYRAAQFQVEMITFGPKTKFAEHRHEHVDSVEVMYSGALDLWVDDIQVGYERAPRAGNGMSRDVLRFVPIPSDGYHYGATVGGACFLSVQKWKGMKPSHVGIEWQDRALPF